MKFVRRTSEIGGRTSVGYDESPGLPALGNKVHCFCQNVTVFQNVSRESRRTRRAVTRARLLRDGMRPTRVWVRAFSANAQIPNR